MVVMLIPVCLSSEVQGFYFAFSSMLSIQIFFELGLSQVLVYRFADLSEKASKSDASYSERLYQLLYVSRLAYKLIALAFFLIACLVGWIFFGSISSLSVHWQLPWLVLVAATSINLLQSVKLVYLESTGAMHHVSVARLRASIISTILFVVVIYSSRSLWAACVTPLFSSFYLSIWLYRNKRAAAYVNSRNMVKATASIVNLVSIWKSDVFPMQWKISLSWISGYFIFQLYTPLALSRFGPVTAGKLGYVVSIMTAIIFVATTFTTALSPQLSKLFSSRQISQFNRLFDQSLLSSVSALFFAIASAIFAVYLISDYLPDVAGRLLTVQDTAIYGGTAFFSGVVYCLSIYLRSQQDEPLLAHALVTGALMLPSLIIASSVSLRLMLLASLVVNIASSGWACLIYLDSRKSLASSMP